MIDWLLEGDPAIRWQTMRDLTDTAAPKFVILRTWPETRVPTG